MLRTTLLCSVFFTHASASAQLFLDYFESGLGAWTVYPDATALTASTARNVVPPGGQPKRAN